VDYTDKKRVKKRAGVSADSPIETKPAKEDDTRSVPSFRATRNFAPELAPQELRASPDKLGTAKSLLSPARMSHTFPARPGLIWEVRSVHPKTGMPRYLVLPCGTFKQKSIKDTDFTQREKELTLPIYPNREDILGRPGLQTEPFWSRCDAYQVLSPVI
jgi:hypothetical protein